MARKVQSAIARSIVPTVGASTLADLESRTDSATVTAPASEGLRTGRKTNFSGQYLFDRFVANDKAETTKLDLVRQMSEQLDVADFTKCVNGMVEIAASYRDKAIEAAKEAKTYNKDAPSAEIAGLMARFKTAANHQTVMRVSYGAIKFAPDELAAQGYTETTGYMVMGVIARKALAAKGIKWDGSKIPTATEKDRKAATKAETKALENVMEATPREDGETMAQYLTRCGKQVEQQLQIDNAKRDADAVEKLVKKVRELAGSYLDDVIEKLLTPDAKPTLDPVAAAAAAPVATKH